MEDNIAGRLKLYIDSLGITSSQFADMCNIPRPSLSQLLTGRNKKVSNTLVGQIHEAFPDLSIVWLMFGEGPVRVSSGCQTAEKIESSSVDNSVMTSDGTRSVEYSKEMPLKSAQNDSKVSENKVFESDLKILELQKQIEYLRQNPRKVVQITIYYEDSTFETFYPGGRKS